MKGCYEIWLSDGRIFKIKGDNISAEVRNNSLKIEGKEGLIFAASMNNVLCIEFKGEE